MDKELSRSLQGWKMESCNLKNCGALIRCIKTNRFLFLLRNGSKFSGHWAMPGGKIEKGESVKEALMRELVEEIGINFSDKKLIPVETYTSENKYFEYHTFLIDVDEEFIPLLNKEHRGWCWAPLRDCPTPAHAGLLKTLKTKEILDKFTSNA